MSAMTEKAWSKTEITRVLVSLWVVALLAFFARGGKWSAGQYTHAMMTRSVADCRQILDAMRRYAVDHDGRYPDGVLAFAEDSNAVFRQLIVEGVLDGEKYFRGGYSAFLPDGNIGDPPDFRETLRPGENHWAMTKGLSVESPGSTPLVYENPAGPTWPPTWNADAANEPVKGRAWKTRNHCMIIVGLNDTSVVPMVLESNRGAKVSFPPGKNPFSDYPDAPEYEVLDVAILHE